MIRCKEALRFRPRLCKVARSVQERALTLQPVAMRLFGIGQRLRLSWRDYPLWGHSRVERLLVRYGFRHVARLLRARRRVEEVHGCSTPVGGAQHAVHSNRD